MSGIDDFMAKAAEKNLSDASIATLLGVLDVFAKQHLENPELLAKAAEVRAALIDKMNNKELLYDAAQDKGKNETKNIEPMSSSDVIIELRNLRELERNPEAYMEKCEEILKNPRDVTLAEQAIYGMGNVVEKNPDSMLANRAVRALELCTDNKALLELDTKFPHIELIENAMKATKEKIEKTDVMSSVSKVDGYIEKYSQDRLHTIMDKALEKQKKEQEEKMSPKMALDEDKLPKIKLAGNAGKDSVVFDLNSIAEDIKNLKPGESLALGRNPEAVGAKGKTVKVGENNNYISRHHCDIRRNEQGKLELVDSSMNGTEILNGKESALHNLLDASRRAKKTNLPAESQNSVKASKQKQGEALGQMKQMRDGGR